MFERSLSPAVVEAVIADGEVIQQYSDDQPYPSQLLLGWHDDTPLHVVVARNDGSGDCIVVTALRSRPEALEPRLQDTEVEILRYAA
jgi:hypothetical protein